MSVLKIMYGPYEAYGVIKHRFQRLRGLYDCLTALGYEIELVEINLINRLTIEFCKRKIFSCDIRNIMFNMDCDDDTVCKRAISAIEEACMRFNVEGNVPKHASIPNGTRQNEELQNVTQTPDNFSGSDLISPYRWSAININ
ncbi:hypothetical protein NQ315_004801 [Exocentrus adspersus]|uniref:Uncharacterized protein n=1 Tax=Exocentrus adspersus TaxID=1586481 RepID=A0AAV8W3D2_9CUCU|nr:hypothetical protein NQ315_004801 [Exocentrus adspersus]